MFLQRSNDALNINPPTGDTHALVTHGSDWLWAVDAVYCFSFLTVVGLAYFARSGEKIFHYLFTISLFVGSITYFACASDLGSTPVIVADTLSQPGTREIFYAKYINWYVIFLMKHELDTNSWKVCWLDTIDHCPWFDLWGVMGHSRL